MRHARERVTCLRQWLTRQVCWPNRECHLQCENCHAHAVSY